MTRPSFNRSSILRGGALVGTATIGSAIVAAVLTTTLGAHLGDEQFGAYAFVIATASLLEVVSRLGLSPIIVRDLARTAAADGNGRASRRPIRDALGLTLIVSIILAAFVLSAPGSSLLEALGGDDAEQIPLAGSLVVLFMAQGFYTVATESLRGLHRLGWASTLGLPVQRVLSLVAIAWAVVVLDAQLEAAEVVWIVAISAGAAALMSGGVLWRLSLPLRSTDFDLRPALAMAKDGTPILFSNILGVLGARLPVWALALVASLGDAGEFAVAASLVSVVELLHQIAARTLSPFIATAYHGGDRESLESQVRTISAGTSVLTIVASGVLLAGGAAFLPRILDPSFRNVVPLAAILLIGSLAWTLGGPCDLVLNLTGNEAWTARGSLIGIGVAAVAIFPVSLAFGAPGAAVVTAAATILRVGFHLHYVRRRVGMSTAADFAALARSVRRRSDAG